MTLTMEYIDNRIRELEGIIIELKAKMIESSKIPITRNHVFTDTKGTILWNLRIKKEERRKKKEERRRKKEAQDLSCRTGYENRMMNMKLKQNISYRRKPYRTTRE